MACRWVLGVLTAVVLVLGAPPKRPPSPDQEAVHSTGQPPNKPPSYRLAYSKYLEQVVKTLENDPKFPEKLKSIPESDIKSGKIADHISDLSEHTFTELSKAKKAEIDRLQQVINEQVNADGGAHNVKIPQHIDTNDWNKFTQEDLRMLIRQTVADMDDIDKHRKEDFKEYEMKKQADSEHKVKGMSPEEREKYERFERDKKRRHNEHEAIKHPGSRDQLEEVWEDSDKMDKESYNPKTFFALHDLNADGMWSEEEIAALFQLELQKVYNESNPDDDPRERVEEMYRMREHVMQQIDTNNDRMISWEEFKQDAEKQTPNTDEGWKDIGDETVYSEEEFKRFEEEYAKQQGWDSTPATTVSTRQPSLQDVRVDQPVNPPAQQVNPPAQQHQVNPPAQANAGQLPDNGIDKTYGV